VELKTSTSAFESKTARVHEKFVLTLNHLNSHSKVKEEISRARANRLEGFQTIAA
jgi:hypothetical protein